MTEPPSERRDARHRHGTTRPARLAAGARAPSISLCLSLLLSLLFVLPASLPAIAGGTHPRAAQSEAASSAEKWPRLPVDADVPHHAGRQVRRSIVDIDVAVAGEMLDYRNPRLLHDRP